MGIPARLVLATGNAGKLREMREILAPWRVDVRALSEFTADAAEETGLTFVENALLKARFAARVAGLPAIADDSGLEVDALHGAPGIHSARYAGPAADDASNNALLLRELAACRCRRSRRALPLCDGVPALARGSLARDRASRVGRSYRPCGAWCRRFRLRPAVPRRTTGARTAAELDPAEKNQRSHRGQALRGLVAALASGAA